MSGERRARPVVIVLVVVAIVAAAAWALLARRTAEPAPTSSPTASAPVTSPTSSASDTASPTSTVDALPWAAWISTDLTQTPEVVRVLVRTPTGATLTVEEVGDAAVQLLGWTGPDLRTLVYAVGQDLTELRSATVAADGSIAKAAAPLTIPGLAPAGNGFGYDGEIAWAAPATAGTDRSTISYVGLDQQVTTRPGVVVGQVLWADRDVVVTAPRESVVRIYSGTSYVDRTVCLNGVAGLTPPTAPVGELAVACQGDPAVHLLPVAAGDATTLPAPDAAGEVRQLWYDADGVLQAATTNPAQGYLPTEGRTWRLDGSAWVAAERQGVLRSVDGPHGLVVDLLARGSAPSWTTRTEAPVVLGPGQAQNGAYVPTLVLGPDS